MTFTVARVPAPVTYPLRRQVLRPHQDVTELRLPTDEDPDSAAFAARAPDGTVLGTAAVHREPCPWRPDRRDAWRLRGMATADGRRSSGIGSQVLAAAIAHVASRRGGLLWCHARTPAQDFYERTGFTAHGQVWEEPQIGPHIRMWREVAGPPPADPAAR